MSMEELKELQLRIIKKNKLINRVFLVIYLLIFAVALGITLAVISRLKNEEPQYYLSGCFAVIAPPTLLATLIAIFVQNLIKFFTLAKDKRTFYQQFKNIVVLSALKNTFNDIVYEPYRGIPVSEIDSIQMMDTGDRFSSNDFISGTYHGINFQQSDVKIEEKHETRDSNGNTHTTWVTIFLGRWMIFDFNKTFKSNLQVVSPHFKGRITSGHKIKLEDISFNKQLSTYAKNDLEAFYILTPHFMEKVKTIKEKLNCDLMLCFVDNKLHVAVNNKIDSFEHNVFKKIDEEAVQQAIVKDIKLITDFADDLNLDNDLFKKEV